MARLPHRRDRLVNLPLRGARGGVDLQRLLEGSQTVRVFIDTWVNPGHANGAAASNKFFDAAGQLLETRSCNATPCFD